MVNIAEIMSTEVQVVEPQDSLRLAAELMQELDVGALPVCDGERLLGMITDRDITVRGVAQGLDPEATTVSDIMTSDVEYATADQDSSEVLRMMGDKQIRRMPVIDLNHKLVGIVSLADLALKQPGDLDAAVREISEPGMNVDALR